MLVLLGFFFGILLIVIIFFVNQSKPDKRLLVRSYSENGLAKFSVFHVVDFEFSYNVNTQNRNNHSLLVVPRRAYYDNRIVNGKPRNILVILAEVEDATVKDIVACEINGYYSKKIHKIQEYLDWVRVHRPGYTHSHVTIQCFGLPHEAIINGSDTGVIYKKKEDDFYSRVQTEKSLLITRSAVKNGSVLMCTTLFGHPQKFDEWLRYQRTISVDLVKLNVHSSFSQNATEIYPYLKEALDSGIVEMETWNDITGNKYYYHGQIMKYQDCVYRYMNTFEYTLFFDYDDFLNPVIPGQSDVHYYFSKIFADDKTGSVYFPWKQMQCAPEPEALNSLSDGNLTSILSGNTSYWRTQSKCAHRLRAIDSVNIHNVQVLLPEYTIKKIKSTVIYVAHHRKTTKLCH